MIMYATHGSLTIIVTGYRAILRVENSKRSRYKKICIMHINVCIYVYIHVYIVLIGIG
jgi:hypothetical protein